jgi:hypothetical protein
MGGSLNSCGRPKSAFPANNIFIQKPILKAWSFCLKHALNRVVV